jgi:DnaJ-class molecular chaperone
MAPKDYYRILGLNNDASTDAIKKSYRKLAMQYHPDHNHGREEWAGDKFKEITEAFSVLGDPKKKRLYDNFGTVINIDDNFSNKVNRMTFEDLSNDFDGIGLGFDLFDNISDDNFWGRRINFHRFRKINDESEDTKFEARGNIDFEELFEQTQSPGTRGVDYEIVLNKEQALQGTEKELIRKGKRLKVKIPAGVMKGARIRLRNALETTDGKSGDIIIEVNVK